MTDDSAKEVRKSSALRDAEALAERMTRAARSLFTGTELCADLESLAEQLLRDCRRLAERGEGASPVIAIVGKVAEGKSWLARCFLLEQHPDNKQVRQDLKSGQHHDHRTRRLTWIGVEPMAYDTNGGEQFLHVQDGQLLDLGRPYAVGDTPGFTDAGSTGDKLSEIALSSSSVKLLVTSEAQLRAGEVTQFVATMNGAMILPVVRFSPPAAGSELSAMPSDETIGDVKHQVERWKRSAPAARILDSIFMPDAGIYGQENAERLVQRRLQETLQPLLGDPELLRQAVEHQIHERVREARRAAASLLTEFRLRVGPFVDRLQQRCQKVPQRLLSELLGEDMLLRSGIRQRFRADWLDRTPSICFPYRSFTGLLALTAGAWDKVIFSLTGSVPSLALSFFQTFKNLRDSARFQQRMESRLADRVESLLQAELVDDLRGFHRAVAASIPDPEATTQGTSASAEVTAQIVGLDEVEVASREIMRDELHQHRANAAWLIGLLGFVSFWGLLAGPLVALYRGYLVAWWDHIVLGHAAITEFPTPPLSLLASCVIVSAVPTFVLALIGLAWCCSANRVSRTVSAIKLGHEKMMERQLQVGSLSMALTDDRLEAARQLLLIASDAGSPIRNS